MMHRPYFKGSELDQIGPLNLCVLKEQIKELERDEQYYHSFLIEHHVPKELIEQIFIQKEVRPAPHTLLKVGAIDGICNFNISFT